MFNTAALVVLGIISVLAAIFAIFTKRIVSAIIASGVISLMASIMFLIAAAPELLDMLEKCYEMEWGYGSGVTHDEMVALIAKAKGGKA